MKQAFVLVLALAHALTTACGHGSLSTFRPYAPPEPAGAGAAPDNSGNEQGGKEQGAGAATDDEPPLNGSEGTLYGHLGIDKWPTEKKVSVRPRQYCATLSSRARRASNVSTFWGYALTTIGAGLIATGTIWGAVGSRGTDEDGKPTRGHKRTLGALIAFPIAGSAALPLGPYFFSRAKEHSDLASAAALGANDVDPAKACNAALAEWNGSQSQIVAQLQANMEARLGKAIATADKVADVRAEANAGEQAASAPAPEVADVNTKLKGVVALAQDAKSALYALGTSERQSLDQLTSEAENAIQRFWKAAGDLNKKLQGGVPAALGGILDEALLKNPPTLRDKPAVESPSSSGDSSGQGTPENEPPVQPNR